MPADPAALRALAERVEKGEGADRELDREAHLALGLPWEEVEVAREMVATGRGDERVPPRRIWYARTCAAISVYPSVCSSLDAVLELARRVMPALVVNGTFTSDGKFQPHNVWCAEASIEETGLQREAEPARALLAALLRALAAQAEAVPDA